MRTRRVRPLVAALACTWGLMGWSSAAARVAPLSGQTASDPALQSFHQSVTRYAALRDRLAADLPPFEPRRQSWSGVLGQHYLASAVHAARRGARLGDIFDPAAALAFRQLILDAALEQDIEGLVDGGLDAPDFAIDLAVDETVPGWALREVPALLVARLPALPRGVEYRLVGEALILWDTYALTLIDAIPNALVAPE